MRRSPANVRYTTSLRKISMVEFLMRNVSHIGHLINQAVSRFCQVASELQAGQHF
nr:MAG TPA: hypothetical protein [Caudoviricetes sp.]DAG86401.1 MAG TPA: hypothetical protein [Caudoviricetes sp.]